MEMMKAWEKQPEESIRAFDAFRTYRDMGAERSLAKVAQKLNKSKTIVARWCGKYNWVERVIEYDKNLDSTNIEATEKAIKQMCKRQIEISMEFQEKVTERLKSLDVDKISISDLIKMYDVAVKIEKEARGFIPAYELNKIRQGDERLEIEKAKLNNDDTSLKQNTDFLKAIGVVATNIWKDEITN